MNRIRTKQDVLVDSLTVYDRFGGLIDSSGTQTLTREWMSDRNNLNSKPPQSPCLHVKVHPTTLVKQWPTGERLVLREAGDTTMIGQVGNYVFSYPQQFVRLGQFEFQDNNSFEIINFLAEIDDVLEMFSKSFLRQLRHPSGYGAINWGVLPFLSDLKSVYNSLVDIFSGRLANELANGREFRAVIPVFYIDRALNEVRGTIRLAGVYKAPPPSSLDWLAIMLDEIGLNPDVKSAWDLIPFSFLVDYIVPVGDYLEGLHPRGWFKPVKTFYGSATFKLECRYAYYHSGDFIGHITGTYYNRTDSIYFDIPPAGWKAPDFKAPSIRQLLNASYIWTQVQTVIRRR